MLRHETRLTAYAEGIEQALDRYLSPRTEDLQNRLFEAMRYSVLAGGKRIRPVLLLEFCRISGGDTEAAMPFACALEMIHSYSLIHDDLPCMDNDTHRRGRPCNHIVFGEATALLAGDGLLTAAFETMLDRGRQTHLEPSRVIRAAHIIAKNAGAHGMAGGQQLDMDGICPSRNPRDLVMAIHTLKTGALITAAAEAGCVLGGASEEQTLCASAFAKALGLAFQIRDDILNVEGNAEVLGKPVGSDQSGGKLTFVQVEGIAKCKEMVASLTEEAVAALRGFEAGGRMDENMSDFLIWLAKEMVNRKT